MTEGQTTELEMLKLDAAIMQRQLTSTKELLSLRYSLLFSITPSTYEELKRLLQYSVCHYEKGHRIYLGDVSRFHSNTVLNMNKLKEET